MNPVSSTFQRGLSLIELIISIVIISIALAGVLLVINTNVAKSADPMIEHQAIATAQSYLEEITAKAFVDPDGNPADDAAGRAQWDDVRDYNGLSGAPADENGTPIPGLSAYNVSVSVDTTGAALGGLGAGQVERVDITVTGPSGVSVTVSGYRTSY